jgi:hypothetical protein
MYPQQWYDVFAYVGQAADDHVVIRANHGIIESDAWEWVDEKTMNHFS